MVEGQSGSWLCPTCSSKAKMPRSIFSLQSYNRAKDLHQTCPTAGLPQRPPRHRGLLGAQVCDGFVWSPSTGLTSGEPKGSRREAPGRAHGSTGCALYMACGPEHCAAVRRTSCRRWRARAGDRAPRWQHVQQWAGQDGGQVPMAI